MELNCISCHPYFLGFNYSTEKPEEEERKEGKYVKHCNCALLIVFFSFNIIKKNVESQPVIKITFKDSTATSIV